MTFNFPACLETNSICIFHAFSAFDVAECSRKRFGTGLGLGYRAQRVTRGICPTTSDIPTVEVLNSQPLMFKSNVVGPFAITTHLSMIGRLSA